MHTLAERAFDSLRKVSPDGHSSNWLPGSLSEFKSSQKSSVGTHYEVNPLSRLVGFLQQIRGGGALRPSILGYARQKVVTIDSSRTAVNTRNPPHLSACEFVAAILRYMPSRVTPVCR